MREDGRVKLQLQQQAARDAFFIVIVLSGQGSAARVSKVFHLSKAISWAWLFSFYSLSVRISPSTQTWTLQISPDACVRPLYAVGDKQLTLFEFHFLHHIQFCMQGGLILKLWILFSGEESFGRRHWYFLLCKEHVAYVSVEESWCSSIASLLVLFYNKYRAYLQQYFRLTNK